MNQVLLTLLLDGRLSHTSFLTTGSYVKFGSDYLYVASAQLTPVPEPASLVLVGLCALALAARLRKQRPQ